jgi:transposase
MPSSVLDPVVLSAAERAQLESWTRRRSSAQALALRSRIVLLAADGRNNTEIARELGIHRNVAGKWRARFVEHRLDGLTDEPRPGRPRTVTDEQVEEVIVRTLETTPKDATHWSTRSMARELGLTQSAVHRIWKAFGLQPHRQQTWKLSKDPLFVDKVKDVVGLYLDPPERAVVLCVDEKSQIQALDRSAPILPMLPGTPERATHDYKRSGTSSLYAALDITTGKVIGALHSRHRAIEFKQFLATIDRQVPDELAVHLVLDNSSTHKTPAIRNWLAAHPRFVLHFTPTSSSWLNLVERWFAELTTKKLRRGAHRSVRELNTDIRAWIDTWNDNPQPFVWTKTAEQILDSIARYCTRINESRHERSRSASTAPPWSDGHSPEAVRLSGSPPTTQPAITPIGPFANTWSTRWSNGAGGASMIVSVLKQHEKPGRSGFSDSHVSLNPAAMNLR